MYLPLPTASIFFRSQTTSGASENGSENAKSKSKSKSSGRSRRSSRSGRSPSVVEKRDQSRKPSASSSSGQMQTSYFMSEPRIAGSGMQEERVYLVAACRRNGCCLNLISEQDGEYISFPSLDMSDNIDDRDAR